jgi:3-oxoacyl-[acyl-carrier-protein] synthase-3
LSFSIKGTGSAYPARIVTNHDLSDFLDTSDEWIRERTGISERRICVSETLTDLAVAAAEHAMENAGVTPNELDLILCATLRPDTLTPSLACRLQAHFGAECAAFDVNAACSGFLYAMDVADGYFMRKRCRKVLVVAAEAMSKLLNWKDRSTCVLFGDAAGAVVLEEGNDLLSMKLTSKGSDVLLIPHVEANCPYSERLPQPSYLLMQGHEVFKFAVNAICSDLADVIAEAGVEQSDIDYVLLHQANKRIIDAAKKRLSIPNERFMMNIERFGNTSSASIPLLLDELNRQGVFHKGELLALSAFGGGLTTGACVLRWN